MSTFEVVKGETGKCLLLDGTRIAGPKAWGGGTVESTFTTKETFYQERTCRNVACSPCAFRCGNCGWFDKNRCDFNFCPNCGREVEGDWGVVNLYGLYEAVFGVSPESPVNISQKEVDRLAKRIGGFFGGDLYEIKRSDGGEPK